MTPWKLSPDGKSALRTLDDGISMESRIVESISAEELAAALPADPLIIQPDSAKFLAVLKKDLGGILAANALAVAYPLLFVEIENGGWSNVGVIILDAKNTLTISNSQYMTIKNAAASFSIPIQLH